MSNFLKMPDKSDMNIDMSNNTSFPHSRKHISMKIATKLLSFYSRAKKITPTLFRNYTTITRRELEVPTFCDIHIDLPFHIRVKPLNIHKYHNCDKLIIQVDERFEKFIEHDINGNQVRIFNTGENEQSVCLTDIYCSIKAPVKANLYINSQKDILVGYFNGDKLHLKTDGDIFVDKFQGSSVQLEAGKGHINIKEFIQASTIIAETLGDGSINIGRLQGLNVKLKANNGNISVESCYANESHFEVVSGNLYLHNIHKSCQILLKNGNINLTGFDGHLTAFLKKGHADIQLTRITNDSEIRILDGQLNLKITEGCQDHVQFEVQAKYCDIAENVKSTISKNKEVVTLTPDINKENTVFVQCLNGAVNIESASWQDMIKMKLKK